MEENEATQADEVSSLVAENERLRRENAALRKGMGKANTKILLWRRNTSGALKLLNAKAVQDV